MDKLPSVLYAVVLSQELKTSRVGKLFWKVILKTPSGIMAANMWDAPANAEMNPNFPHTNDIIEITGFDDQRETKGNIVIRGFNLTDKEHVPEYAQVMFDVPKASEEEMSEAMAVILDDTEWQDINHYKFAMNCLEHLDIKKFKMCPAGERVHHSYQGGLVIHTAEVLGLCRSVVKDIVKKYSFINADVLRVAAILHDLGKLWTYCINESGIAEILPLEKTIGHIYYGMKVVETALNDMRRSASPSAIDVGQDFIDEVLHCIASHHGELSYGSIVKVQSIEAGILSKMDYISARNGMMESQLSQLARTGSKIKDAIIVYGDRYFQTMGMKEYLEKLS
jgi:3'-5' exoribonuclease